MDLNKLDLLVKELRSIELETIEKPDSLNTNIISKFTEVNNKYKTKGNPYIDTFVITYRNTLNLIAVEVFNEAKRVDTQSRIIILDSLHDIDRYLDEILKKVNGHNFQSIEKLNPIAFYRDISPCLLYANKVIEMGEWDMKLVNDVWDILFDRKIVSRDLISLIEKLIENQNDSQNGKTHNIPEPDKIDTKEKRPIAKVIITFIDAIETYNNERIYSSLNIGNTQKYQLLAEIIFKRFGYTYSAGTLENNRIGINRDNNDEIEKVIKLLQLWNYHGAATKFGNSLKKRY